MKRKTYADIPASMRRFIKKKCRELGSYEAVEQHYLPEYGPKDLVTRYSLKVAKELYGGKK